MLEIITLLPKNFKDMTFGITNTKSWHSLERLLYDAHEYWVFFPSQLCASQLCQICICNNYVWVSQVLHTICFNCILWLSFATLSVYCVLLCDIPFAWQSSYYTLMHNLFPLQTIYTTYFSCFCMIYPYKLVMFSFYISRECMEPPF